MKKFIPLYIAFVLLLTSCLVGKRYNRPEMQSPDAYMSADSAAAVPDTASPYIEADSTINLQWFDLFGDTVLNELIIMALDSNTNLKVAALRVQQSRSVFKNSKANVLPSFGYTGQAQMNEPAIEEFNILGTATWEIDFWGKLRHAKRASYAEMIASEEGLKTVKTTLVSDVANLYFIMRDLDNRIEVARQTVDSRTIYYLMVNERWLKGESAELDKLQAEQQVALAEATLASLRRELSYTERSLNILLGQNPQPLARGLQNDEQVILPEIPAGLPSKLLEQRPDVKAAENYLIAETERIGVAQAMRLPSFSLTGFLGVASTDIGNLLSGDAFAGGLTGMVMGPIFEFGKNKRRVDIQRAEAEIALNNFLNTYRTALGDVENALVSIKSYSDEYKARLRQVEAARKALMLTKAKYDAGYSSYLEVLIAESYAFDAEMLLSMTRAQQLSATVALYRALGGGW
ncbi:MAG: efflux transporter outer membrane subunit [Bacteroidales bacterium]|nr:efflux transporter outer membrane subunit [Bacteroidales bacterium]